MNFYIESAQAKSTSDNSVTFSAISFILFETVLSSEFIQSSAVLESFRVVILIN